MIELKIIADIEKGSKGKCDATDSTVEEVAMMIALLEKYKQNIQKNFNKLSDFEYDSGVEFKEKKKQ